MDARDVWRATAKPPPLSQHGLLGPNWPYLVMLALALLGVALTSLARQTMTFYWMALAPVFALVSLFARRREAGAVAFPWGLLQIEAYHWLAVMIAMQLVLIGTVRQMMNADASALMTLTILALGTFSNGLQIRSWRLCLVGIALAAGVPIIALIDRATLILFLLAVVFAVFLARLYFHKPKRA